MRTSGYTEEPLENSGLVLCSCPSCSRISIPNLPIVDTGGEVESAGPTISIWGESFERNDEHVVSLDRTLERRRRHIVASGTRVAKDCVVLLLGSCCFITYLVVFFFIAKLLL